MKYSLESEFALQLFFSYSTPSPSLSGICGGAINKIPDINLLSGNGMEKTKKKRVW
ncbi:MAG: hypothetical protein PVI26_01740 [Chitinispirillia bacterium]|jgi:hypothetical protein